MSRSLLIIALILTSACRRLPGVVSVLPDFQMTAIGPTTERPFGRSDMLGKVWVVDFIYTRCAGPCPLLTQSLARLSGSLPSQIGLLSITVDPEGDTPARLRAYAKAYGANTRWVFLRGTMTDTYQLLFAGFHLPLSLDPKAPPGTRVQHSTRFALVDSNGAIRRFYDGLSAVDNAALARDARRLLEVGS